MLKDIYQVMSDCHYGFGWCGQYCTMYACNVGSFIHDGNCTKLTKSVRI